MTKYELGLEIYTDCINALKAVEEIVRLTLDDACAASNTSELTVDHGRQIGGRQGHEGHQSSQRHTSSRRHTSGQHHTPAHDHIMEEASQTADEMCLDIGYDMGSMAHDDAGPSHMFAHEDTSRSPSMVRNDTCPPTSSITSSLPTTHTCPLLTTGTAPIDVRGRDEIRFMPSPSASSP